MGSGPCTLDERTMFLDDHLPFPSSRTLPLPTMERVLCATVLWPTRAATKLQGGDSAPWCGALPAPHRLLHSHSSCAPAISSSFTSTLLFSLTGTHISSLFILSVSSMCLLPEKSNSSPRSQRHLKKKQQDIFYSETGGNRHPMGPNTTWKTMNVFDSLFGNFPKALFSGSGGPGFLSHWLCDLQPNTAPL